MKPVVRGVWALAGEHPDAHEHRRFERRCVTAFDSPATGECFWHISNGVSKPVFEALPVTAAKEAGTGRDHIIVLVLDNAGWRAEINLKAPDGIRLLFLPPYTPELQLAEHLWEIADEPIINQHIPDIDTLVASIAARCVQLAIQRETIRGRAGLHPRPKIANASYSTGNRIRPLRTATATP